MFKLNAIVVDDEALAQEYLCALLAKNSQVNVIDVCSDGRSAVKSVQENHPDIIFLDIKMPGLNGFDVVKSLQSDEMPLVIFTTAFDQYAVDAFEVNAVDYVLKPLMEDRVHSAVDRAFARIANSHKNQRKESVLNMMADVNELSNTTEAEINHSGKLAIKDSGSTVLVPLDDIDWIDAAGDYMCVNAKGQSYIMRSTMKQLEEKLAAPCFARIHRSTMVNLNKVQSISQLPKGEYNLRLENGNCLKVSRNYRKAIAYLLD